MARRLAPTPDPSTEYTRYFQLNAAADLSVMANRRHPGINEEIAYGIEKRQSKPGQREFLDHNEICRRIRLWQISTRYRIQQMEDNPLWSAKGSRGSSVEDFRAAPRTFVKTVQEIFSRPEDRMVVGRDEDLNGALGQIIIDPRRISNTVLENLGLDEFIPEKGLKQEQQLERRAEAIPQIKDMLRNLHPIRLPSETEHNDNQRRYFRAMRIGSGPNKGHLIGTQHIDGQKRLFKTDLPNAERRLLHIEESYNEEIRKLEFIEFSLNRVLNALQTDWEGLKQNEEAMQTMKDTLTECVENLDHSSGRTKRSLRAQIDKCTSLKDSTGRYNPTAMGSALRRALRYLDSRHRSIERIWRYVGQDKAKIAQIKYAQEVPVDEFLDQVERMHGQFRLLRNELELTEDEKGPIREALTGVKAIIHPTFIRDRKLGFEIDGLVDQALEALEGGNNTQLMEVYNSLLSIPWPSVPMDAHSAFGKLRKSAPNPMYISVEDPFKSRILDNLSERQRDLQEVQFEPYLSFARSIDAQISKTKEAISTDDADSAANEFISVYIMSKLYRAYTSINDVHTKVSVNAKDTDPKALLSELETIHEDLSQRFVAPTVITPQFNEAFKEMHKLLNSLKKRLRELLGMQEAEPEAAEAKSQRPGSKSLDQILEGLVDKVPDFMGFKRRAERVVAKISQVRGRISRITTFVTREWATERAEQEPTEQAEKTFTEDEKAQTFRRMKDRISEVDFPKLFRSCKE
jgi:hypothetical protein